jgi:hypothetical protein
MAVLAASSIASDAQEYSFGFVILSEAPVKSYDLLG